MQWPLRGVGDSEPPLFWFFCVQKNELVKLQIILKMMAVQKLIKTLIFINYNLLYCNRLSKISWLINITAFK